MPKEEYYSSYLEDVKEWLQSRINGMYNSNHLLTDADKEMLRRQLKQVSKASLRWQQGKYGQCERCEGQIDWTTREAFPQATVCSHCDLVQSHLCPS